MRRLALSVVIAAGLLAGCGMGPTDEAARSAGITPPDVLAFFSLSLDPSVEQKRHLLSVAEAFPKADIKDEFDQSRDELLEGLSDEAGLDYETQVKPVLGPEVALAFFPPSNPDGEPEGVLIIEIDDEEAAKKLAAEGTEGAAYRIVGDHLLATMDGPNADALFDRFEGRSEGGGLSAKPEFERLTSELHGDRLLLGWVDLPRLVELAKEATEGQDIPFTSWDPWNAIGKSSPAAFDLHAENQAMVFEAVSAATGEEKGSRPVITEGLPADLLGALTVFDLEKALGDVVESFTNELGDEAGTGDLADELGLDPERDILSWWGGETVLAVGPMNDATGFPDAALIVEPSDRAAAEAGELKLIGAAEEATGPLTRHEVEGSRVHTVSEATEGLQPAFGLLGDRFIFATSLEYLEQVATEDTEALSESDGYESVIDPDTSGATQAQLYLDVDRIREALEKTFDMDSDEDYMREARPNIEPLDRFGMRAARIGDLNRVRLEITVS